MVRRTVGYKGYINNKGTGGQMLWYLTREKRTGWRYRTSIPKKLTKTLHGKNYRHLYQKR